MLARKDGRRELRDPFLVVERTRFHSEPWRSPISCCPYTSSSATMRSRFSIAPICLARWPASDADSALLIFERSILDDSHGVSTV